MTRPGIRRLQPPELAVLLIATILFSSEVYAAEGSLRVESPESLVIAITIDSEHLIELYQSVPGLKIIDARHHEDHTQGYIETSFNLPLAKTDCKSLSELAGHKEQAMVFYCNGNAADASIGAIQIAADCGYKRLFWFRGGFVEWQDKDYPYLIE
jgi:rhodanese-related sulfurtransferase